MRHWRRHLFSTLPVEQRLVNIIIDEVHLKSGLLLKSVYISGTSVNNEEKLAAFALVFEMISVHGSMIVFSVPPEPSRSKCWGIRS